jgi:hypothetical protein
MRFIKIKFDGSKVKLEWDIAKKDGEPDLFSLTSADLPAPEFQTALDNLRIHVEEICELPKGYCKDSEIRGVSFSYGGDDEIMGAVITSLKTLNTANSPLTINTPHLPSDDYSSNNPSALCLSFDCIQALNNLMDCAENYVNGIRLQQNLFEAKVEPNLSKKVIKLATKFQNEMQEIVNKDEGINKISISSPSFDNGEEVIIAEKKAVLN